MKLAVNSMLYPEISLMISLKDIRSLTDFQRNVKQYLQHIRESQKPMVLTVNGKAEVIVQSAEAYQDLLDRLERAEAIAAIRQGIAEFERGEGRPARHALEALRVKHGISG
jgi:PHD/YefM family antitoxin component YafN of YafNO toxin-antitoxin module